MSFVISNHSFFLSTYFIIYLIISSHSNNPRIKTNWLVSMTADISTPNSNAWYHFTLRFAIRGNNAPAGNRRMQFNRSSFNNPQSWYHMIALQNHKGISSYWRTVLVLVNTVEPKTIARKITIATTAPAWMIFSFFFHRQYAIIITISSRITLKARISYFDHFLLYVVHIW